MTQESKKPRIIIPDTWRGINTKEAYEKVMAQDDENTQESENTDIKTQPTNIIPKEYLQIPQTNYLIAEFEPDWTKGFNYETSHKTVLERELQIPTPELFMKHFVNIVNAYKGESEVYDAEGDKLTGKRLENIYLHFTTNHINNGAWSWLNAKFVKENNNIELETVTGIDPTGSLITKKTTLEKCLMKDGYIDLEFNKQGLAVKKSKTQEYKQGQNIYFLYPRENTVARFYSNSKWADLNCDGNPVGSDASLGVFASFQRS